MLMLFLLRFLAVYTLYMHGNSGALEHLVVQFVLSAELCLKRVGSRNVNRSANRGSQRCFLPSDPFNVY